MASFRDELIRLQKAYTKDIRNTRYRAIVYGGSGSGKTFSLRTARLPLYVHSFDPGGSKVLADLVRTGKAIVDTSFENENPKEPSRFQKWMESVERMNQAGVFKAIGTYVVDSATTWGQCALYQVLKSVGREGTVPQQNDWYPQMNLLEMGIRAMITLPCDVILLAHDTSDKDEISGRITRAPLFTGKLSTRLPILFDEIYYASGQQSAKGTKYVWQLQDSGINRAKSRLSGLAAMRGINVPGIVPQNFKAIINAAGYDPSDLELFPAQEGESDLAELVDNSTNED